MDKLQFKYILLVLFLIIFFAPFIKPVLGEENTLILKNESINPGSFYYPFKRLIEKGRERLIFSQDQKRSFYNDILKVRLSELSFVISNKMLSEVQGSSERFAYTAGILTEEVIAQKKTDEKQNLIKQFGQYSKFLDTLRDKYPANSSFWMLVQHDINTLSILSDQLK